MHIACVVIDEISWLLSMLGCVSLLPRHFASLRIWQQQELWLLSMLGCTVDACLRKLRPFNHLILLANVLA